VNVKHLDTLVGPRTGEHQYLYDSILDAFYNHFVPGDKLKYGKLELTAAVNMTGGMWFTAAYNGEGICHINSENVSSYYIKNYNGMQWCSLDVVCAYILSNCKYYIQQDGWEVL
jgi:hypothetical protein